MIDNAELNKPVSELEFSNRTRNVILRNFSVGDNPRLRDLAALSRDTLLGTQGCGRKSLNEIETVLSDLGLRLGVEYPEEQITDITEDTFTPAVLSRTLFTKLSDLDWSVRTENCLKRFYPDLEVSAKTGLRPALFGDLIILSRFELSIIPNMGRKSIAEIEDALAKNDLHLGMNVLGWNDQVVEAYLEENRKSLKTDRKKAALNKFKEFLPEGHVSLEDEISALLSFMGVKSGRNTDMFLRNTGLDGNGGATLEEIGQIHGVTRERVRQIVKRDKRRFKDGLPFKLEIFEKVCSVLSSVSCASTENIEADLKSKGYLRDDFDLRGIFELDDIINQGSMRFSDYEIDRLPGTDIWYLFRGDMRNHLKAIRAEIKRQSSNQGYAKISDLVSFCLEKEIAISQDQLMSVLTETGDLRFLNSEQDAFVIIGVRNRLFNGISKCLIAHRPLKAVRIKDGLRRYARLTQIPTTSELLEFCKVHPDLKVDGNEIDWSGEFDFSDIASEAETQFIDAFNDKSEILSFKELQAKCLRRGMNPTTFYLYTRQLPCLESDGYGRFALRGCPGDPFNLDRSSAGFSGESSLQTLQNLKEGTTSQGHYWLAFELDEAIAKSGAFIPSARFTQLLQQSLNIESASGEFYGKTSLIGQGVSGFKTAFMANGAEAGDMIILVYNADLEKIIVALGSDDQLETAKNANPPDMEDDREMVEL